MNRREPRNVLAEKIPEIKDVPKELPLMVFGEGSFLGEEDVIFRDYYSCTLKCISQNGVLLQILKEPEEFVYWARNQEDSWL
jgi:CRP-like cAMP-binding protein